MYYIYIIRCSDNSLYTGITTDVKRRMTEHFTKSEKCAKYTRKHTPSSLEAVWSCENRTLASKMEYRIKQLSKISKENFIKNNEFSIFNNKLESGEYERIYNLGEYK